MTQQDYTQHLIAPPPELVDKWREGWRKANVKPDVYSNFIATQAAQWGADMELEACCKWLEQLEPGGDYLAMRLRAVLAKWGANGQ